MVYGSFFKIYQTITILTDSLFRHSHGQLNNYLKLYFNVAKVILLVQLRNLLKQNLRKEEIM